MKQLTVRGLGDDLGRVIRRLAVREGTSLNRAAVKLMNRGAGLAPERDAGVVGSSLDHLIGSWSQADTEEVERALRHFDQIDESMWE